jgi:uncharacterized metal-binding protein
MGSYILGTEIFNPDLDTYSKPYQRIWPISWFIKKIGGSHRKLLHKYIIGSVIIETCLVIIFMTILLIINKLGFGINSEYDIYQIINNFSTFWQSYHEDIVALSFGIILSNQVHLIIDDMNDTNLGFLINW